MDEKRAIVAVVLIFLVLFGFNYWQAQQRQKVAAEQAGTEIAGEVVEAPAEEVIPAGDEGARGSTTPDEVTEDAVQSQEVAATPVAMNEITPERTVTPIVAARSRRGSSRSTTSDSTPRPARRPLSRSSPRASAVWRSAWTTARRRWESTTGPSSSAMCCPTPWWRR